MIDPLTYSLKCKYYFSLKFDQRKFRLHSDLTEKCVNLNAFEYVE